MSEAQTKNLGTLVLALCLVACGTQTSTPTSLGAPDTTTAPSTTSSVPAASTTTLAVPDDQTSPASQTEADAQRDGVIPELAALPLSLRADVKDSSTTTEGVWAISVPPPGIEDHTEGCRLGSEDGFYPTDFICTDEYGELLLLDGDAETIRKAVPLPGVPSELLLVTDDAVFCGRGGAGRMPDSMVCRVDRVSGDVSVMVFPGEIDSIVAQPCFYPPTGWTVAEDPLHVGSIFHDEKGLWVEQAQGWALLDDRTLEVVEIGLPDPRSD